MKTNYRPVELAPEKTRLPENRKRAQETHPQKKPYPYERSSKRTRS